MLTDFKISEEREVDGIVYQKVRFYEGAITTEDEHGFFFFGAIVRRITSCVWQSLP